MISNSTDELLMTYQAELIDFVTAKCEAEDISINLSVEQKSTVRESWNFQLLYLAEALRLDCSEIFNIHLLWDQWSNAQNTSAISMVKKLNFLDDACRQHFPADNYAEVNKIIQAAVKYASVIQPKPLGFLNADNPLLSYAEEYLSLLLHTKKKEALDLITGLRNNGISITDIYEHIFKATQHEVGYLWLTKQIGVGQEHFCTAATQVIMTSLYPDIFSSQKIGLKMIACSAAGDIHEMGIRMIADLFEMGGWDTYYLGGNMPDDEIIKTIKQHKPDLLAISVTMPFHISKVQKLIAKIRSDPATRQLLILAGGEPFRLLTDMWKKIGADGFAENGMNAITLANNLIIAKKISHEAA